MTPNEAIQKLSNDRLEELADKLFDLEESDFNVWIDEQEDGDLLSLALPLLFLSGDQGSAT